MKILMVNNPISGGDDKSDFLKATNQLCDFYGISFSIFQTTGVDDVEKLKIKLYQENPDKVASVGGDGTSLMTAQALLGTRIPFGIVPFGSANGMAKELGVPSNPIDAFRDILLSQKIIPLDLVGVNNEAYLLHLGDVGINAYMVEKFSHEEERGWLSYAKHFIDAISNEEKFTVKVKVGGKWHEHEAYSVIFANARMYGTGVVINSRGNPHDGVFEIVVIQKSDFSGLVNLGLTSITKETIDSLEEYYTTYQANEFEIEFDKPRLLQLDGEVIGERQRVSARILETPLRYITTSANEFLS